MSFFKKLFSKVGHLADPTGISTMQKVADKQMNTLGVSKSNALRKMNQTGINRAIDYVGTGKPITAQNLIDPEHEVLGVQDKATTPQADPNYNTTAAAIRDRILARRVARQTARQTTAPIVAPKPLTPVEAPAPTTAPMVGYAPTMRPQPVGVGMPDQNRFPRLAAMMDVGAKPPY